MISGMHVHKVMEELQQGKLQLVAAALSDDSSEVQ